MKKVQIIFITMLTMLMACNNISNVEDVDVPHQEQKLVVQSFISPQDTLIKVSVTLSQPIFNNPHSNDFPIVENAVVKISDGIITKTLTFFNDIYTSYYSINTSEFPIVVGKTYYLTVTTPDGKSVKATTTIPSSNKTLTCSLVQTSDEYTNILIAQWNDPAGTEDYYQVWYANPTYYDSTIYDYPRITVDYTDKNSDGMLLTKRIEIEEYSVSGGKVSLIHASKEYYLYHSKVKASLNSEGNPFSENIQVYSNIDGGYGIFAGFNIHELIIVP
jgi:hypothetical protein